MNPYIYKQVEGEIRAFPNPEWEALRLEKKFKIMLNYSGIPADYHDLSFDAFSQEIVKSHLNLTRCIEYATNPGAEKFHNVSLFLYGINSSGKSTVACAIGQEFLKQDYYVKFVQAGDLAMLMHETISWGEAGEEARRKVKELDLYDLVIIDDAFDAKKSLQFKQGDGQNTIVQGWDTLIRRLTSHDVRLIFTSNIMLSEISTNYSRSLYELLDRNCIQLEFLDDIKKVRKSRFEGIWQK